MAGAVGSSGAGFGRTASRISDEILATARPAEWARRLGLGLGLVTGHQPWTRAVRIHMTVLLRPQLAIGRATLEKRRVRRHVEDFSFIHHQNLVAFRQ